MIRTILKNVCSECKARTRGCVACKKQLINAINNYLNPIREKRKYYEEREDEVKEILMEGTNKARKIAKQTMERVKKAMMLDY